MKEGIKMFNSKLLDKYTSWTKEELDEFYNSQFEMAFPWLDEVKQWIEDSYNISIITIGYENEENTHKFYICLYDWKDYLKIASENGRIITDKLEAVENNIKGILEKHSGYNSEDILCKISDCFFKTQVLVYISYRKAFELKDEIEAFFSHLSPVYLSVELPSICVFETKEQAKKFLLSEEYTKIKKQIFDLLKPFDDYDVLEESHIRIFVDYKENKEHIPMYSRWVRDLNIEEWDRYEKNIINP